MSSGFIVLHFYWRWYPIIYNLVKFKTKIKSNTNGLSFQTFVFMHRKLFKGIYAVLKKDKCKVALTFVCTFKYWH